MAGFAYVYRELVITLIIASGIPANQINNGTSTTTINEYVPTEVSTTGSDLVTLYTTPEESLGQAVSKFMMFKVGVAIHRYYLPVLVVLGFIGNCLSLAVMTRSHNRQISCCVYMGALAVSDNVNLLIGAYYWSLTEGPHPIGRPILS